MRWVYFDLTCTRTTHIDICFLYLGLCGQSRVLMLPSTSSNLSTCFSPRPPQILYIWICEPWRFHLSYLLLWEVILPARLQTRHFWGSLSCFTRTRGLQLMMQLGTVGILLRCGEKRAAACKNLENWKLDPSGSQTTTARKPIETTEPHTLQYIIHSGVEPKSLPNTPQHTHCNECFQDDFLIKRWRTYIYIYIYNMLLVGGYRN